MNIDVLELRCPNRELIPSMRNLWKEAFGDSDEFLDSFFDISFAPERCRVVASGKEALGALYIFDCEHQNKKIAYIYAVATRKSARGQGICKNLMENTHRYLADKGYAGAILVPSEPTLFDFYAKLGYKTCTAVCEFDAEASNSAVALKKIEKSEYINSRRVFLPQNSVSQENYNIEFLATYASFYKGENFLLAAYKADGKLRGIELLGDANAAPSILRALECDKGTFRAPPSENTDIASTRPFAMYFSIDKNISPPEYFGIAFD